MSAPLMIFSNPDKRVHRSSGPDPCMPKWPFRALVAGPPNSGKRNLILNVIFMLEPPPSAIHIVHYDPQTEEYGILETLGVPIYYYDPKDFLTMDNLTNPEVPTDIKGDGITEDMKEVLENINYGADPLVIIDEVTSDVLGKASTERFERLMNFGSSHKNTTVICSIQSIVNLPAACRRGFNHYALWKQSDRQANTLAATRVGITPDLLYSLFELCHNPHDSIWIDADRRNDDRYRFRLNFTAPITSESVTEVRNGETKVID